MNEIKIMNYKLQWIEIEPFQHYTFSTLETLYKEIDNGFILLFQHNELFTGIIGNGKVNWLTDEKPEDDLKTWQKIHIFNEISETLLLRKGKVLTIRKRTDKNISVTKKDNYLPFYDTSFLLRPVVGLPLKKIEKGKYMLVSRNYIDFNEMGQAGIVDSRLLCLKLIK